jgi:hypothetical protein
MTLNPMSGSVLETATILSKLLRPEGYTRDVVTDLSVGEFITHERTTIAAPATMHLLALKKALLYVIPIISPPGVYRGILLTSQVTCSAIQYSKKTGSIPAGLAIGDKFRLIGFAFPSTWTNHLARDIFPWKYYNQQQTPLNYTSVSFDLEVLDGISRIDSPNAYLIDPHHYEDTNLFNRINEDLVLCLSDAYVESASIMVILRTLHPTVPLPVINRIHPFNKQVYLPRLNAVLPCWISSLYTMYEYECLQATSNWRLYDEIRLFGIDSPSVVDRLTHLQYVKEQMLQVRLNKTSIQHQRLLETRGEKIARERYPYLFDYTNHRSLFVRFNRFSIKKLPVRERDELRILIEKELQAQDALLNNHCEHITKVQYLTTTRRTNTDEATIAAFHQVEPYINYDTNANAMHLCKVCSYPLLCQHEIELYTALASIDFTLQTVDMAYLVRQRIVNKYKITNRQRTGYEDTEVQFTFYCRICSGELGKSNDVIQAGIQTRDQSTVFEETTPLDASIFSGIAHIVKANMNPTIVPATQRTIVKLIYREAKSAISKHVERVSKLEKERIDVYIRYLTYTYACSSLIAIKVNKLETSHKILLLHQKQSRQDGGAEAADIKVDFVTAYTIIQSNVSFKSIGVTEVKAKALLIHAFKAMNRAFASEAIVIRPSTPLDRLRNSILTSPVTKYALFMFRRHHKERRNQVIDPFEVLGIHLATLAKTQLKSEPLSDSLFSNIYVPILSKVKRSALDQYIEESYQTIVNTVVKRVLTVTAPLSDSLRSFEATRRDALIKLRTTPTYNLPCTSDRIFNFDITNFQLGYCLEPSRPHRWSISNRLEYVCERCKVNKTDVPTDILTVESRNKTIESSLDQQMIVQSFFELYTLSCPVKDIHEYHNEQCSQCGVRKEQLELMDPAYYAKYSSTYLAFRQRVTNHLLQTVKEIRSASNTALVETEDADSIVVHADHMKLESLGNSLSKLFGQPNLNRLGLNTGGQRVLEIVESYVRLLYSHYTFAKNLSVDTTSHPDMNLYMLLKETSNLGPFAPLPIFPRSSNADALLTSLFQIIYDMASIGDAKLNKLLQFIVDKIVTQQSKHLAYNVGKLRTTITFDEETEDPNELENESNDMNEESLFAGYDIEEDDQEDNMNGEYE